MVSKGHPRPQLAQGIKHIGRLKRDVARAIKTSIPFRAGDSIAGNINSDDMVTPVGEMQRKPPLKVKQSRARPEAPVCCLVVFALIEKAPVF